MVHRHRPNPSERLQTVLTLPGDTAASRAALVAAVGDISLDVARAALRRLRVLAGPDEIAELRRRMLQLDIGVVGDVAATLRDLDDPLAAAIAAANLSESSSFLRHKAAVALRELREPAARPALLLALEDPDTPVRRVALEALRELPPDPETVSACRRRLDDSDASVRCAAIRTIARLDDNAKATLTPLAHDRESRVRAELGAVVAALATDTIRVLLSDADAAVRARALRGLTDQPRAELAATVIAVLADVDWHVRRAACDAVASVGSDRAATALVTALVDSHPSVRGRALVALERLAPDELDQILIRHLEAASAPLRRALVEILGRHGQTTPLLPFVSDSSVDVRLAVARALAADRSAAARSALDSLCDDEDAAVRHAATTLKDTQSDEPRL